MDNKIIVTVSTAIIDDNITKEQRIAEYEECFNIIKGFGYEGPQDTQDLYLNNWIKL
jgi:hypothetical protein